MTICIIYLTYNRRKVGCCYLFFFNTYNDVCLSFGKNFFKPSYIFIETSVYNIIF